MLGGHVDVVPVSIGSWVSYAKAGQVRVIAVSSAKRLPGLFADVPTWREQGMDVVVSNWRTVVGPKNATRNPAPVTWGELENGARIEDFRIENMPARIAEVGDLWAPLAGARGRFDLATLL